MRIRRVFSFDSSKLEQLLLSLAPNDRRFRFSGLVRDETIQKYVRNLKWSQICVYGMIEVDGTLVGAVEIVPTGSGTELALEVLSTHKHKGIGRALIARAMLHAKVRGLKKLQILCTSDNAAMQNLAKKVGMTLTREHGEVAGLVTVADAGPADYMAATWCQVDAAFDSSLLWASGALRGYRSVLQVLKVR